MRQAPALDPVEIASGLVFGLVDERLPQTTESPRAAVERVVAAALCRPPCLVSFSGGRDSSAVLAVAAHVARREGLPLPVPATNRFPDAPASREDEWQEQVVAHLQLDDWVRLDHRDELDSVGAYARRALLRHGLLWPFNSHFHLPLLDLARGGSLLTGIGGDELLGQTSWSRQLDLLRGRVRPVPRDLRRMAFFLAPGRARRRVLVPRFPLEYRWLRPEARREVVRRWARQHSAEPRRASAHARWRGRFRYQRVALGGFAALAEGAGATALHPLLDDGFRAAVVGQRFVSRTDGMRRLFGDVLPEAILARETKSGFDEAFFAGPSRELIASWHGDGVDTDVVDSDELAAEWASERPDPRSFLLLQSVWLRAVSGADPVEQRRAGVADEAPVARTAELPAR